MEPHGLADHEGSAGPRLWGLYEAYLREIPFGNWTAELIPARTGFPDATRVRTLYRVRGVRLRPCFDERHERQSAVQCRSSREGEIVGETNGTDNSSH